MTIPAPHPFVSSEDSRTLLDLVAKQAHKRLVDATCCTDVDALFGAVTGVVYRALADAARHWNLTHDRLRRLPPELQDLCMGSLPTADKCQLASVCSFWRDTISKSPSLWSDVNLVFPSGALSAILARSGQTALRLALTVSSPKDWNSANEILRTHSHRLQRLHINFDDRIPHAFSAPLSVLDYPTPSLCELKFDWISRLGLPRPSPIPRVFFTGVAPQLRSISLRHVRLPDACPALSNVSYASIEGAYMRGIEQLFTVLPALRRLDLVDLPSKTALPAIPRGHPVAEVRFLHFTPTIDQLEAGGYLRVHRLVVGTQDRLAHLGAASRALSTTSHSSLVISAAGATALILRSDDDREAIFSEDALFLPEIRDALRDGVFRDVSHLVLPLFPDAGRTGRCPLLQGAVDLPRLLSLQIRCGRPTDCSLLDSAVRRGIIVAPLLARFEITTDSHSQPTKICASHLAHFIETTLELGDASALELVIDTAHGMLLESACDLEDQVARLQSCVGALYM